jgi:hypothetical protein
MSAGSRLSLRRRFDLFWSVPTFGARCIGMRVAHRETIALYSICRSKALRNEILPDR